MAEGEPDQAPTFEQAHKDADGKLFARFHTFLGHRDALDTKIGNAYVFAELDASENDREIRGPQILSFLIEEVNQQTESEAKRLQPEEVQDLGKRAFGFLIKELRGPDGRLDRSKRSDLTRRAKEEYGHAKLVQAAQQLESLLKTYSLEIYAQDALAAITLWMDKATAIANESAKGTTSGTPDTSSAA